MKKIIFLITLAAIFRLVVLFNSDNYEGSLTMGRVASSLRVLEDHRLSSNFDGNSSVLYHYILAGFLYLWPDPLVAPRFLSLIFGALLIIPFYYLIRILFNDRVAFYSSILLTIFPLHLIQSTLSTSEATFYFFFFSSLFFLFLFKKSQRKNIWYLILSAALFNIASMLRFESWFLLPILSLFLYKKGKRYMLSFFLMSIIMSIYWVYFCHKYFDNAFFSFTAPVYTKHAEIITRIPDELRIKIFGWLDVLYENLGFFVFFSGFLGLIYSLAKRKKLHLSLLFLFLFSSYTYAVLITRMYYDPRYIILLGLFMLPYAIFFIERIWEIARLRSGLKLEVLLSIFVILSTVESVDITIRKLPHLPPGIVELADWLKYNASSKDKIILGSDKWDTTEQDIVVRSGLSPRNFLVINTPLVPCGTNIATRVDKYISEKRPRYLILNSGGALNKIFRFDMEKKTQKKFDCIFNLLFSQSLGGFGIVNIYEIYYDRL